MFGSGCQYPNNQLKIKKIQFPKLVQSVKINSKYKKNILFLGSNYSPFFSHYRYGPIKNNILYYKQFQFDFLSKLASLTNEKILVRIPGKRDHENLIENTSNLEYDNMSKKFDKVIKSPKVIIVDNLNTTFLQCLIINQPTILLINSVTWSFSDDFSETAKFFEEVGILFYDLDLAVKRVEEIINNNDLWFNDKKIQLAIRNYLKKYTSDHNNWENDWIGELESLLYKNDYDK